jgi:hypothetical protein
MEKVSRYLASCEEPPPRDRVEKDVEGKADALRLAMDTLIREGYAAEREGPRGARLMVFVSLFTEEADEVARLSDGFDEEIPF